MIMMAPPAKEPHDPHPQPLPTRGRGVHRVCRLVMAQTAHRFAAGNLLRQRRASALDCVFVRRINRLSQRQRSARYGESNARMDASPDRPSSEEPSNPPSPDAPGNPLPPDVPGNPPPETPRRRRLPSAVTWLAVAVAGVGTVLGVLGLVSLFISGDNGVSALEARLAGLELGLRELASRAPPPSADPKALDEVAGRVAKLEAAGAAPPVGASDPALAARVAALA